MTWRICMLLAVVFGVDAVAASAAWAQRGPLGSSGNVVGKFDYYQLALSWSPTHCEDNSRSRKDTQCGPRRARPYAFILHGLWPQHERGYPEFCRTRKRPFVPNNIIDKMFDIMPSRGLIIHQYKKHGTCSGYTPKSYFKAARLLYERVRIPDRFVSPQKAQFVRPRELINEFVRVNPKLRPDMVRVVCRRGPGNRLREVRICFDKKGRFRACSRGASRHLCQREKMFVPPVRLSR